MKRVLEVIALAQDGATRAQLAHRLGVSEGYVDALLDNAERLGLAEIADLTQSRAARAACQTCVPDPIACAGCPLASTNHENMPL